MKIAKVFWISGSILVNVTVVAYIWLQSGAPARFAERMEYMNSNWNEYGYHWRAEFLLMSLIAIGAFYFAVRFRDAGWSIVTLGQVITLATYPIMLGGYRNTPLEMSTAANQIATVTFVFGQSLFYFGLVWIYFYDDLFPNWLRTLSVIFAGVFSLAFFGVFLELWDFKQMMIIGPIGIILNFINAYYGMKLE